MWLVVAVARGEPVDLEGAVAQALARHPELVAVEAEVDAAKASRTAAGRAPNPALEVEWIPDHATDLRATWNVTDLALAPVRRSAGAAELDLARARARAAAARLAYDVRAAALRAQAADRRVALAREQVELAAAARDLAVALREAGNVPEMHRLAHEAAYERAEVALASITLDQIARRAELETLIGGPIELVPMSAVPAEPPSPPAVEQVVEDNLARIELSSEASALRRTSTAVTVEGWVPDLTVGALVADEGSGAHYGGVVEVDVPLFGQGLAARRVPASHAAAADARADQVEVAVRADAAAAAAAVQATHAAAVRQRDRV
ncbi:MAG: TolC family protein, partial [Myxococcota bacterium]